MPALVLRQFWVWQLATYMFLHGGMFHILFNMLALWMFGTELERIWGTRYFLKFYFVTGIGAGVLTVLFSLLPFGFRSRCSDVEHHRRLRRDLRTAAGLRDVFSGSADPACIVFPVPAKICVAILGAIALLLVALASAGGVANATHLGGLLVGYLFLKGARIHPISEVKYRYLKWKINRVRKKFDVYSGGRANDYDRRVH